MNDPSVIPVLTTNCSSAKVYVFIHEWFVVKSLYYIGQSVGKSNTIYFSATHFPIYLDSAHMQQILGSRGNGFIFGLERRATKTLSPHSGLQSAAPTTSSAAAALNPRVRSLPRPLAAPSLFRSRAPPPSTLAAPSARMRNPSVRSHARRAFPPSARVRRPIHLRGPFRSPPLRSRALPGPPSRARPEGPSPLLAARRLRPTPAEPGRREGGKEQLVGFILYMQQ